MDSNQLAKLQSSYDRVTDEYVARIADELAHKPLDRALLRCLVEQVGQNGPICDLGCGPGHVARFLQQCGAQVCGIDLSPAMVAAAQRLNPDIPFYQGNMLALDWPDEAFGGIAAFYSLIHVPRPLLIATLRELRRVLREGGLLLAAFHIGSETIHLDEWWDQPVALDFQFFQIEEMTGWLAEAGFTVEAVTTRAPYPDVEHPSRRGYVLARR